MSDLWKPCSGIVLSYNDNMISHTTDDAETPIGNVSSIEYVSSEVDPLLYDVCVRYDSGYIVVHPHCVIQSIIRGGPKEKPDV